MWIDLIVSPLAVSEDELRDRTVVVIDVLRASTTILTALANGAREVVPVSDMSAASRVASSLDPQTILLGGERNGSPIEGYHLGNSPLEYQPEIVQGKIIILNTTNGTGAILRARLAEEVLIGAFVNLSALVEYLRHRNPKELILLCAGWRNRLSLEDILCAGMLLDRLGLGGRWEEVPDGVRIAHLLYRTYADRLQEVVASSSHAARLRSLGYEADLEHATRVDSVPVLARYHEGVIRKIHG